MSLLLSKCHIVGNHMSQLNYVCGELTLVYIKVVADPIWNLSQCRIISSKESFIPGTSSYST